MSVSVYVKDRVVRCTNTEVYVAEAEMLDIVSGPNCEAELSILVDPSLKYKEKKLMFRTVKVTTFPSRRAALRVALQPCPGLDELREDFFGPSHAEASLEAFVALSWGGVPQQGAPVQVSSIADTFFVLLEPEGSNSFGFGGFFELPLAGAQEADVAAAVDSIVREENKFAATTIKQTGACEFKISGDQWFEAAVTVRSFFGAAQQPQAAAQPVPPQDAQRAEDEAKAAGKAAGVCFCPVDVDVSDGADSNCVLLGAALLRGCRVDKLELTSAARVKLLRLVALFRLKDAVCERSRSWDVEPRLELLRRVRRMDVGDLLTTDPLHWSCYDFQASLDGLFDKNKKKKAEEGPSESVDVSGGQVEAKPKMVAVSGGWFDGFLRRPVGALRLPERRFESPLLDEEDGHVEALVWRTQLEALEDVASHLVAALDGASLTQLLGTALAQGGEAAELSGLAFSKKVVGGIEKASGQVAPRLQAATLRAAAHHIVDPVKEGASLKEILAAVDELLKDPKLLSHPPLPATGVVELVLSAVKMAPKGASFKIHLPALFAHLRQDSEEKPPPLLRVRITFFDLCAEPQELEGRARMVVKLGFAAAVLCRDRKIPYDLRGCVRIFKWIARLGEGFAAGATFKGGEPVDLTGLVTGAGAVEVGYAPALFVNGLPFLRDIKALNEDLKIASAESKVKLTSASATPVLLRHPHRPQRLDALLRHARSADLPPTLAAPAPVGDPPQVTARVEIDGGERLESYRPHGVALGEGEGVEEQRRRSIFTLFGIDATLDATRTVVEGGDVTVRVKFQWRGKEEEASVKFFAVTAAAAGGEP